MTRIFHPVGIYSLTLPRRLRVIQVCRFVVYFRTILVLPVVPLLALRRHEAILVDKSFHPKNFMHTHASLDDSFWKTLIHEKKRETLSQKHYRITTDDTNADRKLTDYRTAKLLYNSRHWSKDHGDGTQQALECVR